MAKKRKIVSFTLLAFVLCLGIAAFWFYKNYLQASVSLTKDYEFIYIQSGFDFNDVVYELKEKKIITNSDKFEWLALKMKLDEHIYPGKYRITNEMSYRKIINLLKYNKQEKVKLTLNMQIRNMDDFYEYVDDKLELDSDLLKAYFNDEVKLKRDFNLDRDKQFASIVPGVYELNWAISLPDFVSELKEKYHSFWTKEKIERAKKNTGLSPAEVITLASIVQSESGITEEQQKIAGVYLNRLKKNMLLQADPTLIFANKKWGTQRVYDADKEIDSPYNTYKYKGLPPGPICLVYPQAINAVIDYTRHQFIFFCAKPELNGYSDFSVTYEEHQKYARKYQEAMNKKGVK